jgi:alkylation response protein AidB-like acyl-CoA dehydrogenase
MTAPVLQAEAVVERVRDLSLEFAEGRRERQARSSLDPRDFERLREAGFLLCAVPTGLGGIWTGPEQSTRHLADMLRYLARADSSLALVSSMHPAVIAFSGWLTIEHVPAQFERAWRDQRAWVFESARSGSFWGTITSEPGSGGDVLNTRAVAKRAANGGAYLLSGEKHFGSGSGIASYMITTALPEAESEPDVFFMDMRGIPWDGSSGVKLRAEWDGHGMQATQSHAMTFHDFPAQRVAWPESGPRFERMRASSGGLVAILFAAVIVGIAQVALETAREQLRPRHDRLRPYEQVEWARAEMDGWLIEQAYEGLLRGAEGGDARHAVTGKTALAELTESLLTRLCRILGGGTFSRSSPFGNWFEDVRALGFLRPPWGLAFDAILSSSWS